MKLSVPKRHIGKKLYTEIWKDVVGYDGKYMISNMGRVKSLNYNKTGKEKILKAGKDSGGYLYVRLSKEGKSKNYNIHRLVALHFIPNPNNLPEVNHKDEDKTNNTLSNLEWCDRKYNMNHGTRNERASESLKGKSLSEEAKKKISESMKGKNNSNYGKGKPIYCVELDKTYPNANQCAKELGLDRSSIRAVCKGKYKQTGGYHFYYVENILYKN